MANAYHDAEGKFCSKTKMLESVFLLKNLAETAFRKGDIERSDALQRKSDALGAEYEQIVAKDATSPKKPAKKPVKKTPTEPTPDRKLGKVSVYENVPTFGGRPFTEYRYKGQPVGSIERRDGVFILGGYETDLNWRKRAVTIGQYHSKEAAEQAFIEHNPNLTSSD